MILKTCDYMEKEINIAEILKDKPLDIKLWTDAFGEVTLDYVSKNGNGFNVKHHHGVLDKFLPNGRLYEEGTLCIYPSRNMRDWSKFAWKKGDVLEYTEGEEPYYAIFVAFQDNEYTAFKSHYNFSGGNHWLQFNSQSSTNHFTKVSDEEAKAFIEKVEAHYGGKLNLETLEIEKPEFKDGDILTLSDGTIFINKDIDDCEPYCYAILYTSGLLSIGGKPCSGYSGTFASAKFATAEEKQQFFTALEKEGKRWNSETKTLVDLPKKREFKPMDLCLMRGGSEHINSDWTLCQFSHLMKCGKYRAVGGCAYNECIPYNEETKHLLGTTDDWKGGEV